MATCTACKGTGILQRLGVERTHPTGKFTFRPALNAGYSGGGEGPCSHCGGTGTVSTEVAAVQALESAVRACDDPYAVATRAGVSTAVLAQVLRSTPIPAEQHQALAAVVAEHKPCTTEGCSKLTLEDYCGACAFQIVHGTPRRRRKVAA